jgi:ATP-dependent Clp protease ATP-binding subunit ClpA
MDGDPAGVGILLAARKACLAALARLRRSERREPMPFRPRGEALPAVESPVPLGDRADASRLLDERAARALGEAFELAAAMGDRAVGATHLFAASLGHGEVPRALARFGLAPEPVREALVRRSDETAAESDPTLSAEAERVLLSAFVDAYARRRSDVTVTDVFFASYAADASAREVLAALGADERRMTDAAEWMRSAEKTSYFVGRGREIDGLCRVVAEDGRNVILVGSDGVGKTAILAGLAEEMAVGTAFVPASMVAADEEEARARLEAVLFAAEKAGDAVLAIEGIDRFSDRLVETLAAALSRQTVRVVATATPRGFAYAIEPSALRRFFERVDVFEPDVPSAVQMVGTAIVDIEREKNVVFLYDAIERAVVLSDRYLHSTFLPGKAVDVCREAATAAGAREPGAVVGVREVERAVDSHCR